MDAIGYYLDELSSEGEWDSDWPASCAVSEQHHIWEIPQGRVDSLELHHVRVY